MGEPQPVNNCVRCQGKLIRGQIGSMEFLAFFASRDFLSRGGALPLEAWCCSSCGTIELRASERANLEKLARETGAYSKSLRARGFKLVTT